MSGLGPNGPNGPSNPSWPVDLDRVAVPVADTDWRRLDRRMLLVHPVNEVIRFLPALVAIFVFGSTSGGDGGRWWHVAGVVVPVGLGLLRYATTRFRISEDQVQLRKGLLSKHIISTPLDRVRTIDLTASPIHRLLGLSKVVIGTGSSSSKRDERLSLDALALPEARSLRESLLHGRHLTTPTGESVGGEPMSAAATAPLDGPGEALRTSPDQVLVRLDPSWVRYAPLTTSGVVVALAALGFIANLLNQVLQTRWADVAHQASSLHVPIALGVVIGLLVTVILVSVLAIIGYLLTNWGFTLSHNASGRSYHLRRGLLTTRETSIDEDRVRGLEIGEPLGLRLAGGGRLSVIVTGLEKKSRSSSTVVPPAPVGVVRSVGDALLDEQGPFTATLVQHGLVARRRRFTRAGVPALAVAVAVAAVTWQVGWPLWVDLLGLLPLLASPFVAADRYAGLGHALTPRYLVVRSGSFSRRRDALERDGIIGWNLDQSFFQRRAGVLTLTATTAAGRQGYRALDLGQADAVALADEAVPGLLRPFLA